MAAVPGTGPHYPAAPMNTAPTTGSGPLHGTQAGYNEAAPAYGMDNRYATTPGKAAAATETYHYELQSRLRRCVAFTLALMMAAILVGSFFIIFWAKKGGLLAKQEAISGPLGGTLGTAHYRWGHTDMCYRLDGVGALPSKKYSCSNYHSANNRLNDFCGSTLDLTGSCGDKKHGFHYMRIFGEFIFIAHCVSAGLAFLVLLTTIVGLCKRIHPIWDSLILCTTPLVGLGILTATIGFIIVVAKGFPNHTEVKWAWIVSIIIGALWMFACCCSPLLMRR